MIDSVPRMDGSSAIPGNFASKLEKQAADFEAEKKAKESAAAESSQSSCWVSFLVSYMYAHLNKSPDP